MPSPTGIGTSRSTLPRRSEDEPAGHGALYIHCQDADRVAEEWRQAGMDVDGPRDEDYGKREGSVTDPDGNMIRFSGAPSAEATGCSASDHQLDESNTACRHRVDCPSSICAVPEYPSQRRCCPGSLTEMRRPNYEFWETEARDATERLRQALAVLLRGAETARDAGTVEGDQFFEALNRAKIAQRMLAVVGGLDQSRPPV